MTDGRGARGAGLLRIGVWGGLIALFLLPLVAMQFTDEVAWTGFDFAVFGVMLAVAGGLFELALRLSGDISYRVAAGLAIAAGFLLVWVNLAVGFIRDEGDPANWMYAGVLAVALYGALAVRFRPAGMARVMLVAGIGQLAAGVIAAVAGWDMILAPTAVFVALWWASAWLFHHAAATRARAEAAG